MSDPQRPPSSDQAALEARLERLAQRRAASAGGRGTSAAGGQRPSPSGRTASRGRRRHPAAGARAAALALSLGSTAALASFFSLSSAGAAQPVAQASIVTPSTTAPPSNGFGPAPSQSSGFASGSSGSGSSGSAASTSSTVVDGAVYHNRWGDVQVEVVFASDGSLQSVDAIRTPNDRGTSIQINSVAVPMLDQEALSAQSAQIHGISGATYTSNDYRRSLQSAIDAARAADITQLA